MVLLVEIFAEGHQKNGLLAVHVYAFRRLRAFPHAGQQTQVDGNGHFSTGIPEKRAVFSKPNVITDRSAVAGEFVELLCENQLIGIGYEKSGLQYASEPGVQNLKWITIMGGAILRLITLNQQENLPPVGCLCP